MATPERFYNSLTGQWITPTDWQRNLKVGSHYMIENPVVAVNDEPVMTAPNIYGVIENDEDCEPGFFYVRGYSKWCPDGELGLFCICDATCPLTKEEFELAEQQDWP